MYSRVYVEITNICNMRCSFCHGHSRAPRSMSEAEYARVLAQLQGVTQYIYHHLMGEPLLHPLLPRFIAMAREAGFRPMITTNGTLLDRFGDELKGLHKANISLHSFEGGVNHREYIEKIAEFARKANENGTVISLRLWNNGHDEGRNDTTLSLLRELLSGEWTENTRGYRIRDRLFLEWGERFEWPDLRAPDYGEQGYCHGMLDHFAILCDGTVVPCCLDSEGSMPLGNVFTEELSEILPRGNAMAEGFRRRKVTEELCRHCGYAQRFR